MKRKRTSSNRVVARNLRRLRNEAGLSQERLCDLTGVHQTYISGIERGLQNITLDTLDKLAKALKVEPAELLRDG